MAPIRIGTQLPLDGLLGSPSPRVFADDPEMKRHADKPWMRKFLLDRRSIVLGEQPTASLRPFSIEGDDLGKHAILVGATGSGKTRLALHLLREQLRGGRCSAVVMDVKADTVRQAIRCAEDVGMKPHQITTLWPQELRGGMPEWNLLAGDPEQAVTRFMSVLSVLNASSWGPRLEYFLQMAVTVAAAQGLTLREAYTALVDNRYAAGLLRRARDTGAWNQFEDEHESFASEYVAASEAKRREYSQPIVNKLHYVVSKKWMRSLFCAPGDTMRIPSLWQEPRLVAVHLDRSLGRGGVPLLASMLVAYLDNASMLRPGPLPVVVLLDELDTHEKYLGESLLEIVRRSRQQGIRLIAGTQTLNTVSPQLVSDLLGNTWLRAFFNMDATDANRVAGDIVGKPRTRATSLELSPRKDGAFVRQAEETYPVLMSDSALVAVRAESWELARKHRKAKEMVRALLRTSGIRGATAAGLPLDEVLAYVPDSWEGFEGPDPLKVRVTFPQPEVTVLSETTATDQAADLSKLIQGLKEGRAVMRLRNGTTGLVQVMKIDFAIPLPNPADWMRTGQPEGRPMETARLQKQAVSQMSEALQAKASPPPVPKPAKVPMAAAPVPMSAVPPEKPWYAPVEVPLPPAASPPTPVPEAKPAPVPRKKWQKLLPDPPPVSAPRPSPEENDGL